MQCLLPICVAKITYNPTMHKWLRRCLCVDENLYPYEKHRYMKINDTLSKTKTIGFCAHVTLISGGGVSLQR